MFFCIHVESKSKRILPFFFLAASLSSCVTTPAATYVAPTNVIIEGRGIAYPNPEAKNVATTPRAFSLPLSTTTVLLKCPDGNTEVREFTNDSLSNDNSTKIWAYFAGGTFGLVAAGALGIWGTYVDSAPVKNAAGLSVVGALGLDALGVYHVLGDWQPAQSVTVYPPGTVCVAKQVSDSDGDGFVDEQDRCPTQPETVNDLADDDGCPDEGTSLVAIKGGKIEIEQKVFFETDKAAIQEQSLALLSQVATVIKNHPEIRLVRVEGHTDAIGDAAANMALSKARADTVKMYLVSKGVSADRLDARGYGVTKPIADNNTADGREKNRRVEFVIAGSATQP